MRTGSIFRFDNTFDYYTPIESQDPISFAITRTYQYAGTTKGIMVPAGSSGKTFLATYEPLAIRTKLLNVKDRNNVAVFAVGDVDYEMYITESAPSYDGLGSIVGWKHSLMRYIPTDRTPRATAMVNQ